MTEINYYGETDNYIHLKFGDCVKMYNFTKDFMEKHPEFTARYQHYFEHGANKRDIPVHFYYNFTDEPAKGYDEIIQYLVEENTYIPTN